MNKFSIFNLLLGRKPHSSTLEDFSYNETEPVEDKKESNYEAALKKLQQIPTKNTLEQVRKLTKPYTS